MNNNVYKTMHKPNKLIKEHYHQNIFIDKSIQLSTTKGFDSYFEDYTNIISFIEAAPSIIEPNAPFKMCSIIEKGTVYFYNEYKGSLPNYSSIKFSVKTFNFNNNFFMSPYKNENYMAKFASKFLKDKETTQLFWIFFNLSKKFNSSFDANFDILTNELHLSLKFNEYDNKFRCFEIILEHINDVYQCHFSYNAGLGYHKIFKDDYIVRKGQSYEQGSWPFTVENFKVHLNTFLNDYIQAIYNNKMNVNDMPFSMDDFLKDPMSSLDLLSMYHC